MNIRRAKLSLVGALVLVCGGGAALADEATLQRVFLLDGTALVSYGEPARVGDRVVFSMPTAAASDAPLHLVNLPAARVDWARTGRYAEAARAKHYLETRAETDYAALAGRLTETLDAITRSDDPARRLALALEVRKELASWPASHFNYRLDEVRQMLGLIDEAIADLRAAAGAARFDLSLTAFVDPPPTTEKIAPPPTTQEMIDLMLVAARYADSGSERRSLLEGAMASLEANAASLPPAWLEDVRAATRVRLENERRIDRDYRSLTTRITALAEQRARVADVRGLVRLLDRVHADDGRLGRQRPEVIGALVGAVQTRLDAARRLQLARDRWALRAEAFRQYRLEMAPSLALLAKLEPSLEQIKLLAGSSGESLTTLGRGVTQILAQTKGVIPPQELRSAHALLVSAVQLAGNAARIRFEATAAGDITRAWDASSAAAGALMLAERARADMQDLFRPPQVAPQAGPGSSAPAAAKPVPPSPPATAAPPIVNAPRQPPAATPSVRRSAEAAAPRVPEATAAVNARVSGSTQPGSLNGSGSDAARSAPGSAAQASDARAPRPGGAVDPRLSAAAAPPPVDVALSMILYSPERKLAIVNGLLVGIGDEVAGARIVDITPRTVTLRDVSRRLRSLTLPEDAGESAR
jgi:hypothetical protein